MDDSAEKHSPCSPGGTVAGVVNICENKKRLVLGCKKNKMMVAEPNKEISVPRCH